MNRADYTHNVLDPLMPKSNHATAHKAVECGKATFYQGSALLSKKVLLCQRINQDIWKNPFWVGFLSLFLCLSLSLSFSVLSVSASPSLWLSLCLSICLSLSLLLLYFHLLLKILKYVLYAALLHFGMCKDV